MAAIAWIAVVFSVAAADVIPDSNTTTTASSEAQDEPTPVHSTHRLIPSVVDSESPRGNRTDQFSPGNITLDSSPFLPSGVVPSYRSVQPYQTNASNLSQSKNFTPSFFIGEVIPEPYIPERFQTSRSRSDFREDKTTFNRTYPKLVPSQTAYAIRKILPFLEHMKHAVGYSMDGGEEQDHVPPVHEPSAEDDGSSAPEYSGNYVSSAPEYSGNYVSSAPEYSGNYEDQHSDRPNYLPHFRGTSNLHSQKPVTFDNCCDQPSPGYPSHDQKDNVNGYFGYSGHSDHKVPDPPHDQKDNGGYFGYPGHLDHKVPDFGTPPPRDHAGHYGGPFFPQDNHQYRQKDQLDHFAHHDADLVMPAPVYPPEPEHPTSHKGGHYKVYQNQAKSPLHGLLHFAAALIPLGLLVAALQPSVIHVNSSQPMPTKYRSADMAGGGGVQETLPLPGLEALERLGLGQLDGADCERRAFCELAVLGGKPEGNTAQRGLWKLAYSIPTQYAAVLGLDRVLKAIKAGSCASLKCDDLRRTGENSESPRKST